jgi:hypothetical protein
MDLVTLSRLAGYFGEALTSLGPAYLLGLLAWRVGK